MAAVPSSAVRLKKVTDNDLELLLAWRSHPDVYRFFRQQSKPLEWQHHLSFWRQRSHRIDYIVVLLEERMWRKVGVVSAKGMDTTSPEVGIAVGEITAHGRGIAKVAITKLLRLLRRRGYRKAMAEIHCDNTASQRLFSKLGFEPTSRRSRQTWIVLEKEL